MSQFPREISFAHFPSTHTSRMTLYCVIHLDWFESDRATAAIFLPLPSPLPHLLLCLSHPPSLHFSEAEASMDPLAPPLSSVTWSSLRTL